MSRAVSIGPKRPSPHSRRADDVLSGDADFSEEVNKLGQLFNDNFKNYADEASDDVKKAGPEVTAKSDSK